MDTYTPRMVEALALHYYDDRKTVTDVDLFTDFEDALDWLSTAEPVLAQFFTAWMQGTSESELADTYQLKPRTIARLLDQTLVLLANYMNQEYPLDIPNITALRNAEEYEHNNGVA